MYQIVPKINGELDINYHDLITALDNKDGTYVCELLDTAEVRSSWKPATVDQFNQAAANLKTLDVWKQEKLDELQAAYEASFTTFQSSALGTTKTYPIDQTAQNKLKDLQDRLIADPNKNTFYFKTIEDGTLVAHTRSQFLQLLDDAEMFKVQKIQKFDSYAAQINAATDIPTVQAIQVTFN